MGSMVLPVPDNLRRMKAGAGLSTLEDAGSAAALASRAAKEALGDAPAGLALLFASPHHAEDARVVLEAVHDTVGPSALIGCVGEAIVGGAREIEGQPAVSVWVAAIHECETFHMEFVRTSAGGAFAGWRFEPPSGAPGPPAHLMIADPFTFPVDLLLRHLNETVPGTAVVGGMASGGRSSGETILFRDRAIHHEGAVGVRLPANVSLHTLVSQGCRPIGRTFVVTRAEENVVFELAGRPPLERLRETVGALARPDRELVSNGLHIGRVIDEYKTEFGLGDFLVRGVMGADPESGAVAVGDVIEVGETVQFHVRDAATADEELRSLLQRVAGGLRGPPAGVLLFTCNGRGSRMFPTPDHDASLVSEFLGGAPTAGFFCAGELGPVGGKNFLHGFTASLAVFVDEPSGG
jgi:small ligand-binding sensory domain FIST